MSYKTMNLHQFILRKEDGELKKDLVNLFELDSDYNGKNDDEYYRSDTLALGYETEAHRLVDEIFSDNTDDVTNINNILDHINEYCHGSYSVNFKYVITEIDGGYAVAVSFLT